MFCFTQILEWRENEVEKGLRAPLGKAPLPDDRHHSALDNTQRTPTLETRWQGNPQDATDEQLAGWGFQRWISQIFPEGRRIGETDSRPAKSTNRLPTPE